MRIGFITLSCAFNYGAVLQTYALSRFLQDSGYECVLIDYITERYQIDAPDFVYASTIRWSKNIFTRFLWRHTKYLAEIKKRECFRSFIERNVPKTNVYLSNQQLSENLPDCDIFISGSDQIWNTDFSWDKRPDLPYFLDFVPENIPKIAYSSSFGKTKLRDDEKAEIKSLLQRYLKIGTREKTGKAIVEGLGLIATTVVDPTLLCDSNVWSQLSSNRIVAKPYIVLFQIFRDKELEKTVKFFAKDKDYELIILSTEPLEVRMKSSNYVTLAKVEDWLSYFKYADYIFTDSFHATVFSMIFHRQFVSSTKSINPTRITDLLSSVNLENRATLDVSIKNVKKICEMNIDYSNVDFLVDKIKEQSVIWLLNALQEASSI